jgi:hypothetical protein
MRQFLIIALALLVGCSPTPTAIPSPDLSVNNLTPMPTPENSYAPQPGDAKLQRGPALVEESGILTLESFPLQVQLALSGSLPDPCHQLRIQVHPPDETNEIAVEVYSVYDPNEICIQVIEAFSASVSLGSFPSGHYTVTVNGKAAGEFDA